jgi:hypothetical protein
MAPKTNAVCVHLWVGRYLLFDGVYYRNWLTDESITSGLQLLYILGWVRTVCVCVCVCVCVWCVCVVCVCGVWVCVWVCVCGVCVCVGGCVGIAQNESSALKRVFCRLEIITALLDEDVRVGGVYLHLYFGTHYRYCVSWSVQYYLLIHCLNDESK